MNLRPRPRLRRLAPLAALAVLTPLAAVAVAAPASSAPAPAAATKPNIVYILTDDLDQRTTPYWDVLPKTKQLLADRGMTLTNSFAPTPICCPARSTILTGEYGHNTGVLTNQGQDGGWETFVRNGGEQRTWPKALQEQAGYKTALIGKYLNGYGVNNGLGYPADYVPPGWSEWYGAVDGAFYNGYGYTLNENGKLVKYGLGDADYSTDVVARKGIDFIDRAEADDAQPFALYLASTAPHAPLAPPRRYADNPYADSTARHLPNFEESDLSDKPAWLRASATQRRAVVDANNDRDWQNRMGSLLAVDDMVSGVVGELAAKGELANTYLVFTSDNGYNLGAHNLVQKMVPYEESLRVPLAVAGPGITAGSTSDAFALQTDVAPTVLQLAGLPVPSTVDGRSLVPVLRGRTPADWRTDFLAQYRNTAASLGPESELPPGAPPDLTAFFGVDIPSYRAVRTQTHLYVEWYDEERAPKVHEYELYDLRTDPYQLDNQLATPAGRAANQALVTTLRARLDELATCAGATCR
jgi:N-acetylglucosamine-6-sulfatase